MRLIVAAAALLLGAVSAGAQSGLAQKSCILAAAAQLPAIPGLQIKAAAAGAVPPELTREAPARGSVKLLVIIDVTAAGQDVRFRYLCGWDQGGAVARYIGMVP